MRPFLSGYHVEILSSLKRNLKMKERAFLCRKKGIPHERFYPSVSLNEKPEVLCKS